MNAKKKGNAGENAFAIWLFEKGLTGHRNSSSGGGIFKSDIHNDLGLNIEVKTVKKINLQEAWRQTTRDASLSKSEPILAIRFDGMPKDEWLMVLHSNDWIELIKSAQEPKTTANSSVPYEDEISPQKARAIAYKADFARKAANDLLKEFHT